MGILKAKLQNFRFKGTLMIVLVFALIATILFIELSGVRYRYAQKEITLLPEEKIVTKTEALSAVKKEILVIYSTADKASSEAYPQFEVMLTDMKKGNVAIDLAKNPIPEFKIIRLSSFFLPTFPLWGPQL